MQTERLKRLVDVWCGVRLSCHLARNRSNTCTQKCNLYTVAMTGSVSQFDDDIEAEVDTSVQHMLLSVSSSRQHPNAFCDLLLRWSRGNTSHNMLVSCAQIMRKAEHYPHVFRFIPMERRRQLVHIAADECRRILRFMVNCGMPVNSAENKDLQWDFCI